MAEMVGSRPRKRSARGTLIGGVVALLSFLLLLPLIVSLASKPAAKPASEPSKVPVVVAAKNIGVRTTLTPGDLAIKRMYSDDVPAGAFANVGQAKGMIAAANISEGQPLTPSLVAKAGDEVLQPDMAFLPLPGGYVALTIPTSEQQGVAGYIRPGDYIEVIAVVPVTAGGGPSGGGNTRTVLTNLHVLTVGTPGQKTGPAAANQSKDSSSGANGNASNNAAPVSSSLTVVLTPCQAELLNWFLNNAQVKYALQSSKDYPPHGAETDPACPSAASAQGVTRADIARRYPNIFGTS